MELVARAEEMRRLAQTTPERGTRVLLEVVAKSYDELAERADKRLGSEDPTAKPPSPREETKR
jgi:hypothetical protein